jgi:hypothetical protein
MELVLFCRAFKEKSMSNSNGIDTLRFRQLRAIAENLCLLANWHREHHSYVVADALYIRSLSIAEQINSAENDGNNLGARIRTEQQVAHDLLHAAKVDGRQD